MGNITINISVHIDKGNLSGTYLATDFSNLIFTMTANTLPGIFNSTMINNSDQLTTTLPSPAIGSWTRADQALLLIPLYSIIFLLSVIGNSLVLVTLLQNRLMRTPTNVMLLNLAVSDLLLGIVCMPFTLTGSLLRNFVFGELACRIIPYLQGRNYLQNYFLVAR